MDESELIVWAVSALVVFGPISGLIYRAKGGEFTLGYLFGAILGILGLIIVIVSQAQPRSP